MQTVKLTQNQINIATIATNELLNFAMSIPRIAKILPFLFNENLEKTPSGYVFMERQFETGTLEYLTALAISCLFGAKSSDKVVSEEYQTRFDYVVKKFEIRNA